MLDLKHYFALLLWMHFLTFVQCQKGCTLQDFKQSSLFDENFDISNLAERHNLGTSVRVPCQVGFRGFFRMICSDRGWVMQGEKCRITSCGHPGDVLNADYKLVKGSDYTFGSQVEYTCQDGYQMTSYTNTRTCLQGGWDGRLPECEPMPCQSPTVDDNVLVYGDLNQPAFGSALQFSCSSGDDELIGASQIFCDKYGNWDQSPPTCKEISCLKPLSENFEVEEERAKYKKDEILRYYCHPGYIKVDGRHPQCKKEGQSSQWIPMPQCESVTCKLNNPPEGTTYNLQNQNIFKVGEKVTIVCGEKYWLKRTVYRSVELTCQDTGEWDTEPVCKPVTCLKHAEHVYQWERTWYDTVSMDKSLNYYCHEGYEKTSPTGKATCARRGWEPDPLCKAKGCTKPQHKNAEITSIIKNNYKHNEEVSFRCTHDTEVTFDVQCRLGKWTVSYQTCKDRPCTEQPRVENGEMLDNQKSEYDDGERLSFRCKNEQKRFKVTCVRGQWTTENTCADVPCGTQPNFGNGQVIGGRKSQYQHGDTVEMKCTTGSQETFTARCQSGTWIPNLQCPEKSVCGNTAITNGYALEHQTKMYYACNDGYKPLTKGWWGRVSCEEGQQQTVECIAITDCGPLPVIPNMIVRSKILKFGNGYTFPIQCNRGHQNLHAGLEALTCSNGNWTTNNVPFQDICTPIAKKCKPPREIKNAVIMAPFEKEYLSETRLTYKCRDNLVLDGDATIQCNNGSWEEKNISCKAPTSCGRPPYLENGGYYDPHIPFINNTRIEYGCESGYEIQGGPYKTCVNGVWIGEIVCLSTCKVGHVPDTVQINPHNAQRLPKGQSLQFQCKLKSQVLRGEKSVTCLANGQWSHSFPFCTDAHNCGPPPPLENGDVFVTTSQFVHNTKVFYRCQLEYTIKGGPYKFCLNGVWSGQVTCLKPCTVNKDLMEPNKIQFRHQYSDKLYAEHGEPISFECVAGATHDGSVEMRQICDNGEMALPRCV